MLVNRFRCPARFLDYARAEWLIVAMVGSMGFGLWGFLKGQDVNWDQLNYHIYGAYSLVERRFAEDVLPAQTPSFYNPLLYVPFYEMVRHFQPWMVGAVLGAVHGLNFVAVYALTRRLLSERLEHVGAYLSFAIAVVGVSGAMFLGEIGTSFGDNPCALLILISIGAAHSAVPPNKQETLQRFAVAGLFSGLSGGLKHVDLIFTVGLGGAILSLPGKVPGRLRRITFFGVGVLTGYLCTGGFWAWRLWEEYRNPTFPFWNTLFRSPYLAAKSWESRTYVPTSVGESLAYPLEWAIGKHPTLAIPFRDLRFASIAVLMLTLVVAGIARYRPANASSAPVDRHPAGRLFQQGDSRFLLVFFVSSYVVWLRVFAVQRFTVVLELISGMVLATLVDRLFSLRWAKAATFLMITAPIILCVQPPDWGHLPWGRDWFEAQLPRELSTADTLYVMLGGGPTSYVIPLLPRSARFVRINGNFIALPDSLIGKRMVSHIERHAGPIRTLEGTTPAEGDDDQLTRFGIAVDRSRCLPISTRLGGLRSCPATRQRAPG